MLTMSHPFPNIRILPATVQKDLRYTDETEAHKCIVTYSHTATKYGLSVKLILPQSLCTLLKSQ